MANFPMVSRMSFRYTVEGLEGGLLLGETRELE